jgi:hypothetical protein
VFKNEPALKSTNPIVRREIKALTKLYTGLAYPIVRREIKALTKLYTGLAYSIKLQGSGIVFKNEPALKSTNPIVRREIKALTKLYTGLAYSFKLQGSGIVFIRRNRKACWMGCKGIFAPLG